MAKKGKGREEVGQHGGQERESENRLTLVP